MGGNSETDSEAFLELLSQLLTLTPALEHLNVSYSDLRTLSPPFIDTVLSLPRLNHLELCGNIKVGCLEHRSTSCPVNLFLSQYHTAALSSSTDLRHVRLMCTGLAPGCCGPALEKVLLLGSKGLKSLDLMGDDHLRVLARSFTPIIVDDNFFIRNIQISTLMKHKCSLERDSEARMAAEKGFGLASRRNGRFQSALKILKLARIIFLGTPAPSHSSCVLRRSQPLVLPFELVHLVLSCIDSWTLSNCQIGLIARRAADRNTLLQGYMERKARAPSSLDQQGFRQLLREERFRFLKDTGCDSMDRW